MGGKRDRTRWGAFDQDLEQAIKDVVEKLENLGIPCPTKLEATALIAHREQNNIAFMNGKEIKEFILRHRGFL